MCQFHSNDQVSTSLSVAADVLASRCLATDYIGFQQSYHNIIINICQSESHIRLGELSVVGAICFAGAAVSVGGCLSEGAMNRLEGK